jgi:hypothetical protein
LVSVEESRRGSSCNRTRMAKFWKYTISITNKKKTLAVSLKLYSKKRQAV